MLRESTPAVDLVPNVLAFALDSTTLILRNKQISLSVHIASACSQSRQLPSITTTLTLAKAMLADVSCYHSSINSIKVKYF